MYAQHTDPDARYMKASPSTGNLPFRLPSHSSDTEHRKAILEDGARYYWDRTMRMTWAAVVRVSPDN